MRVLFLYPNINTELRIPLAIAILISAVRKAGHSARLFDTSFIGDFHTDNDNMVKMGTHQNTNLNALVGETSNVNIKEELDRVIKSYKPDLICVSLVERNYLTAKELLKDVEVPVLAGGIMPTIAQKFILNEKWVDMICVGEGEAVIPELLSGGSWRIPNISTKLFKNKLRPLIDMNKVPEQDWSDFDERHLLKPFMGKVYRGGAFEFSRGCFKSCTFCVAPKLREVQKGLGCYHRTKDPHTCIREIEHKIKDYNLEMLSFSDTDFLAGVPKGVMVKFLTEYASRIKLPFTVQASIKQLLDEDILKLLRKAQCCAISVGVESGSEKMQREVIKKVIPIEVIGKAFELCRKHELRVTANYMVGLPWETEEDVYNTISLNHIVNPPSIAVTFFTPFMGTELYDVCVKEGFYKPFKGKENVYDYPPLNMPQLSQARIRELLKEFVENFNNYREDFSLLK